MRFVIDGTNAARETLGRRASLSAVLAVRDAILAVCSDAECRVLTDPELPHLLKGPEKQLFDQLCREGEIHPLRTKADNFLLRFAKEKAAVLVSNDRFGKDTERSARIGVPLLGFDHLEGVVLLHPTVSIHENDGNRRNVPLDNALADLALRPHAMTATALPMIPGIAPGRLPSSPASQAPKLSGSHTVSARPVPLSSSSTGDERAETEPLDLHATFAIYKHSRPRKQGDIRVGDAFSLRDGVRFLLDKSSDKDLIEKVEALWQQCLGALPFPLGDARNQVQVLPPTSRAYYDKMVELLVEWDPNIHDRAAAKDREILAECERHLFGEGYDADEEDSEDDEHEP